MQVEARAGGVIGTDGTGVGGAVSPVTVARQGPSHMVPHRRQKCRTRYARRRCRGERSLERCP